MSDQSSPQDSQQKAQQQLPRVFPLRLSDNYKKIHTLLRPVRVSSFNRESEQMRQLVAELEMLLNDSMPQTESEKFQRVQECLHFHRDPVGYYQHLNDAKLRFLVLWTDYKTITNHFRIRNIIHVRWTGTRYECLPFDKTKRVKQAERNAARATESEFLEETTAILNEC